MLWNYENNGGAKRSQNETAEYAMLPAMHICILYFVFCILLLLTYKTLDYYIWILLDL